MDDNRDFYTIHDLAVALNISYGKARLLIINEPDVLNFGSLKKGMRRVPQEVYLRMLRKYAAPMRPSQMKKAG